MRSKLFTILLLSVLFISFASAVSTPVKIRTLPYHEVQVAFSDPNSANFVSFGNLRGESDYYGFANFDFESSEKSFNVIVYVKKFDQIVLKEIYSEDFTAGEEIYLEIKPDEDYSFPSLPEEEVAEEIDILNETETNETLELSPEESFSFTGFAIFGDEGFEMKYVYYAIGVLVVLIILFFVFRKKRTSKEEKIEEKKEIKVKKLSELQNDKNERIKDNLEQIRDAERKIKEAQEEIARLKKDAMVTQIQKKIEEDKKELERLQRGE